MKKITVLAALAAMTNIATAQVEEHSNTNSRTIERQSSYSNSVSSSRTISPGALFFDHLAELEREIQNNVQITNDNEALFKNIERVQFFFLEKKFRENKFIPKNPNDPVFAITRYCNIFSTQNRMVWSHDPNERYTNSFVDNGKLTFQEPDYITQNSDSVAYNDTSKSLIGRPIKAGESIRCAAFYSDLIDHAITALGKKGVIKGKLISVNNLQKEAEIALWNAFQNTPHKSSDYLPYKSQCFVPTAENIRKGGGKNFKCGSWEMSSSPLSVIKNGVVILDANTIKGQSWQFVDSQNAVNSNSNKSSNTRSRSQKANVAN